MPARLQRDPSPANNDQTLRLDELRSARGSATGTFASIMFGMFGSSSMFRPPNVCVHEP